MPAKTLTPSTATLLLGLTLSAAPVMAQAGPRTEQIDLDGYAHIYYVSATTGSDEAGKGTRREPWASVGWALERAVRESPDTAAILVAAGRYEVSSLGMRSGVDLYGGFDAVDWSRDVWGNRSVFAGGGEGRVLVSADNAKLDGFEVTGGLLRGPGAGLLIDGTSPVLSNSFFIANSTLGPEGWAPQNLHAAAHDGGAIYCTNGGKPAIRNNIFVGNRTEVGRGAAIAYDGHCAGTIADNVLMENVTGLDDPMRSSDGGAISVFRWSSPVIKNNVILRNEARSSNDGGGIFVALWSSAKVRNNLIVGNTAGDDAGGLFVGGQEHRYDAALDPLPHAGAYFVEVTGNRFFGNRNPSRNSGATRITMESRGLIARNVAAHNRGFYLQRSELEVIDNTILEDTRFIESKQGLGPSTFRNNIVWGGFEFDAPATVTDSLFRNGFPGDGNVAGDPLFLDDGLTLTVLASSYSRRDFQTIVKLAGTPNVSGIENRAVVSGDRWSVVRDASGSQLTLWGDLSTATRLEVLPTYRQTSSSAGTGKGADAPRSSAWNPKRINKSIELLHQGQPIYYAAAYGGYQDGLNLAGTWADYIVYNMEHQPLDFGSLREFMRGLVDAGPTPSGHRTPTVIVVLPLLGLDEETVRAGGWMVEQALAQGVHGLHLARARDPEAVKRFVQAARYPIHKQAIDTVGEGLRGWGSHTFAAWVWGLKHEEYLRKADVWPLNPDGEILLGVKIEDQQALANTEATLAVPGLAFAEHGPRDLGLSYGHLEGRADPPLPPEVSQAGDRVLEATRANGLFFLDNVLPDNVTIQIDRGVMIGAGRRQDAAEIGRAYTQRAMPW